VLDVLTDRTANLSAQRTVAAAGELGQLLRRGGLAQETELPFHKQILSE
jgi:hypothetical protein